MAQKTRILSIDGGGIRGILPGQILVSLEAKLKKKAKNKHVSIADYFDVIAGTNAGGVLTFAYLLPDNKNPSHPAFTAQEVMNIYLKHGQHIFNHKLKKKVFGIGDDIYPAKGAYKTLTNFFGAIRLSELLKPCLVPTYNINERKAMALNQEKVHKGQLDDFLLRDAARAATATPGYFDIANIQSHGGRNYPLIDGGIYANNPAMLAFTEVQNSMKETDEDEKITPNDIAMLSLGTGTNQLRYQYDNAKKWKGAKWLKPLMSMVASATAETVDQQLKQLFHAYDADDQYLRINPELKPNMDASLDNASSRNRKALKKLGQEAANQYNNELDRIADQLVHGQKELT